MLVGDRDQRLIGFSLAIPIEDMDPKRTDESGETAYVYMVAVEPQSQKRGLAGPLMANMRNLLRDRAYAHMEIDVVESSAEDIARTYEGAIEVTYAHEKFPEVGSQRFFRINLDKMP
jgi:GNAT superfamily N-acetyltransferase